MLFNESLWFLMLLSIYSSLIIFYKIFGKIGLFSWIPLSIIISNIQVLRQVDMFFLSATLGNITHASSYLSTDILSEKYGKRAANLSVLLGFLGFSLFAFLTNFALFFKGNNFDNLNENLNLIFKTSPILLFASLSSYIISQFHDVWAYDLLRKKFPKFLFIRNNFSTLISQLIDTFIFVGIATLFGIFSREIFWTLVISTYLIKGLAAILDTPFIYIAKHIKPIYD